MAEIKAPKITLRYNGLFDFDAFYAAVVDWAKNYGYIWHELDYKHKVPSPKGAEQEMKWEINTKVTEYISYKILFTVHIWELMDVEVEVDGRKKSLSNARLYIIIEGTVNYGIKKFEKGGKLGRLLSVWYNKIMRKETETIYFDNLYYRIWNLHAILKEFFDMQTGKHVYKGYLKEN